MAETESELAKWMNFALTAKDGKVRIGQHEEGAGFNIRRIDAGKIALPTGRIFVTDAYGADEFPPLNRIVPPGEYPVQLVGADIAKNLPFGGERTAFVVVTFSKDTAVAWQPVTAIKSANPCFTDKRPNEFVQEGGTAIFSPEAGAVHFAHVRDQFDEQMKLIQKHTQQVGRREWSNYKPGPDAPNVIIVEGGMGDGSYMCFVGLDKVGRVTHLVVDYGIAAP